jgi:hypothetical protein
MGDRHISAKERKLMRDAFKLFDTDGDGSVTADELKHVMDTLFHTNLSQEELDAVRLKGGTGGWVGGKGGIGRWMWRCLPMGAL